ncbi:UV radiation resistance protein and autophagy-related subunit 14-domain-containing protein [Boletus edulis]|nr:UV radiation resistance protein and autophagy-related subunit 14-domain-containing protein [Boletus edulis]
MPVHSYRRERLRQLRESLAARRRTLSAARLVPTPPLDALTTKETQELHALSAALARARSGLVQELVEVFHVVEVGGRPPIGSKAGTKGEWTIGDLILPVQGDIRRYPPDHINAVIAHTIHFLGLLTFYLGVKLPFETEWSGKKCGVGQLWIGAGKGGESGSWQLELGRLPDSTTPRTTRNKH